MLKCIFDLDGTIVDSSPEILRCLKQAFEESGVTLHESLSQFIIGPPLQRIVRNLRPELSDETVQSICLNFRRLYDGVTNDISELYDGAYELLEWIVGLGGVVFLATNKPEKATRRVLQKFKLDMFADVYTIDKYGNPIDKTQMISELVSTYSLPIDSTVMIGDTVGDMLSAKAAMVTGCAALWGYTRDKELLKNEAHLYANNLQELQCKLFKLATSSLIV